MGAYRMCLGLGAWCLLAGAGQVAGSPATAAHDARPHDAAPAASPPCTPLVGTRWTVRGEREWWSSVASSADGNKLVAVGGHIYTSVAGLLGGTGASCATAGTIPAKAINNRVVVVRCFVNRMWSSFKPGQLDCGQRLRSKWSNRT
jgi:hypothetical protein